MARFAVIGLGRFGSALAMGLADAGADVIAVDRNRELVERMRDHVAVAVSLDSTDADALKSQGIHEVDVAIVGIGENFEASILTTVNLKEIGVPRVVCRATTEIRARILAGVGADDVVNPENEAAIRWKNRLVAPSILDRLELAEGASLVQMTSPKAFHNKTLSELAIHRKYKVSIVGIKRPITDTAGHQKELVISVPMGDTQILDGDTIIVMGADEAIGSLPV